MIMIINPLQVKLPEEIIINLQMINRHLNTFKCKLIYLKITVQMKNFKLIISKKYLKIMYYSREIINKNNKTKIKMSQEKKINNKT